MCRKDGRLRSFKQYVDDIFLIIEYVEEVKSEAAQSARRDISWKNQYETA